MSWDRHINSLEHDVMSWPSDAILRELHAFLMAMTYYHVPMSYYVVIIVRKN